MLKSCQYCNSIHPTTSTCSNKPKKKYKSYDGTEIRAFRNGKDWQIKRKEIKDRDVHMCQCCVRKMFEWCFKRYNYIDVSVHHIEKLIDRWDLRLDNSNLISLCSLCHRMADNGDISIEILKQIAKEQEEKVSPGGYVG